MKSGVRERTTLQAGAILSVVGLVGVLLYYLPRAGYSQSRLVLFGLITLAAVLGAAGVVLQRPAVTGVGVIGLFGLGFWQAVLSVFIYPVIIILVIATLHAHDDAATDRTPDP